MSRRKIECIINEVIKAIEKKSHVIFPRVKRSGKMPLLNIVKFRVNIMRNNATLALVIAHCLLLALIEDYAVYIDRCWLCDN